MHEPVEVPSTDDVSGFRVRHVTGAGLLVDVASAALLFEHGVDCCACGDATGILDAAAFTSLIMLLSAL